jgi:hypothetical protein
MISATRQASLSASCWRANFSSLSAHGWTIMKVEYMRFKEDTFNLTWAYALYCKHQELCYIGMTSDIHKRIASHVTNHEVAGFRVKLYGSRREAELAEAIAIGGYQPPWNGEVFPPTLKGIDYSNMDVTQPIHHKAKSPCSQGCT